ncbi:response regulator transcription factor [Streptomyces sp. NBC_00377]|uniref:response regulator transcription factor n=1 Tax=unclassified Streptomyces TaxID=2593676 RepID=UPI002E214CE0|nr:MULTISPECIES: response regulator transcription factor [unclassified Streptomyces]
MMNPIRLVLVDDHQVFRKGLRDCAEAVGMQVVAEAGNSHEALAVIAGVQPDVVVLEPQTSDGGGLSGVRALADSRPRTPVLLVSACDDAALVSEALCVGASGYASKRCSAEALLAAITATAHGLAVLDERVQHHVRTAVAHSAARLLADTVPFPSLSRRERQVLELLACGMEPARIARELTLERHTVHNYVSCVVRKLGVENREKAAALARGHGLGHSPPGRPAQGAGRSRSRWAALPGQVGDQHEKPRPEGAAPTANAASDEPPWLRDMDRFTDPRRSHHEQAIDPA